MNPGVIDVQNSHKRALPTWGWMDLRRGRGGRPLWRGFMELGDQSSHRPNWSPQISNPATNGLPVTETCLMVDVIPPACQTPSKYCQFHILCS